MRPGPVVVLLHGIGSGSASWLHCAQRLAAGNRVIAWDAPGCGLSSPLPPAGPGLRLRRAPGLLLDALGVESCLLVGLPRRADGHGLRRRHRRGAGASPGAAQPGARLRRAELRDSAPGAPPAPGEPGAPRYRRHGQRAHRAPARPQPQRGGPGLGALEHGAAQPRGLPAGRRAALRRRPAGQRAACRPCEVHCGEDDGITTPELRAIARQLGASFSPIPGPATPARSNNPKWSQDASATRNAFS